MARTNGDLNDELKAFQGDLIAFYKKEKICLPKSPLVELRDALVADIYVLPKMKVADKPTFGKRIKDSEKKTIYKYKDLFEDQDERKQFKKIFITAGGGMGKSAFALKMMLTWCQAKTIEQNFPEDDIETMRTFDFLFLLELPDSDECDIAAMVQTIVNNNKISVSKATIDTALYDYNCLVLLDGLDQWKHKEECFKTCKRDMPLNRYLRGNVTMVTTSRPWRVIRLKPNDVERHVELSNLTRRASQQLEKKVIKFLKQKNLKQMNGSSKISKVEMQQNIDEFDAKMSASELEDVRYTPYILLQELCLWAKGGEIRKNKFEAYKHTIELTLEKAPKENEPERTDKQVPDYFRSTVFCNKYYHSILELGRLSFRMLCKEIRDKSYEMTLEEAKSCVHHLDFYKEAGILSETKNHGSYTMIKTFIKFQEKAFQEFFSSLFIAHKWNNTAERQSLVKECLRLPNIMEMSNVLSFVRDIDRERHEEIYNIIVKRSDLSKYISDSKQKFSLYRGTFVQIEKAEMRRMVEECDKKKDNVKGRVGLDTEYTGYKVELRSRNCKIDVKKLSFKKPMAEFLSDIKSELRTSKFLHPSLLSAVTLLRRVSEVDQAYTDTFYLMSPSYGDRNLYDALHGDNRMAFNRLEKIRILLQLASGIEYIHTSDTSTAVTHNGICTRNILVDNKKNIRLTWPDQNTKTDWDDYFSFGVVIMEVLTCEEPEKIGQKSDLADRCIEMGEYSKDDPELKSVKDIAAKCLRTDKRSLYTWTDVTKDLSKLYQTGIPKPVLSPELCDAQKCMMCMVNPGSITKPHSANCQDQFRVCYTCELNLHFRPIKCFGCNRTLRQAIGLDWGAIIIAGDHKNKFVAEGFRQDAEDMTNLLTSTAPLIMGIRKENIKVVQQEKTGQAEDLWEKLKTTMKKLQEEQKSSKESSKIQTLVVYISCHVEEENKKTMLGVTICNFKRTLEEWLKNIEITKVIIFMDCCHPPEIQPKETERDIIKIIQINACKPDKTTSGASPFTKYLIETLADNDTRSCKSPEGAYLTATNLLERVQQRFKMNEMNDQPVFYIPKTSHCEDIHIAYCDPQPVEITLCGNNCSHMIQIDAGLSMVEVTRDICLAFNMDEKRFTVNINRDTGRRYLNLDGTIDDTRGDSKLERVHNVQHMILAHVLRQKLTVDFIKTDDSETSGI